MGGWVFRVMGGRGRGGGSEIKGSGSMARHRGQMGTARERVHWGSSKRTMLGGAVSASLQTT